MSAENREIELKFEADAAGLAAALASPLLAAAGPETPQRSLSSIYYDTADQKLRQNRMALRMRRSGRTVPVMALKWPQHAGSGPFARGEAEVRAPGGKLDLSLFDPTIAAELQRILGDAPLEPQFETRIKRRSRTLHVGGAEIEVAFDQGEIVAGDRRTPIMEVELELKSGAAADLYAFAARVAADLPMRLSVVSKAEQAFMFADGLIAGPVRAQSIVLPSQLTCDEAIAFLLPHLLDHFLSNFAALRQGDDPEAIHQMRVALRRLRTILGILQKELPCPEFLALRAEAGRIATGLGDARETDVFQQLVAEDLRELLARHGVFDDLARLVEQRRAAVYRDARALIDGPATTIFAVSLQAFVSRRGWRATSGADGLQRLTEPAEAFARQAFDRLYRRAQKRAKGLEAQTEEQRHDLRIALKNLRYCSEFFWSIFDHERATKKFVRATSAMQDLLGAHNDAAGAQHVLSKLDAADAAGFELAKGLVLGWCAHGGASSSEEVRKGWKAFRRADPFWE